ncbi:hypothetical protein AB1N83_014486 [Pleurotus pulmonarius]
MHALDGHRRLLPGSGPFLNYLRIAARKCIIEQALMRVEVSRIQHPASHPPHIRTTASRFQPSSPIPTHFSSQRNGDETAATSSRPPVSRARRKAQGVSRHALRAPPSSALSTQPPSSILTKRRRSPKLQPPATTSKLRSPVSR